MALKLGTEDKKKVYIAAALGVLVLGLVVYNLKDSFGGSSPAPAPATSQPVAAQTPSRPANSSTPSKPSHDATKVAAPVNLDPTLHPELMAQAESLEYTGNGRNIFSLTSVPIEIPNAGEDRAQRVHPQKLPPGRHRPLRRRRSI